MSDVVPVTLSPAGRMSAYVVSLDGLRAVAALGVLTTHVAFQTGGLGPHWLHQVWGRLDLAVAVFFALSGFLLWRPHAGAARQERSSPPVRRYLAHRFVRIWPAYAIAVVVVLLVLPDNHLADATVWLANLTLTQIYVPLTLTAGLTQMWSLAVEASFYLLLPVLAWAMRGFSGRRARMRIPVLAALGLVALGWAPLTTLFTLRPGITATNWLPGYLPWFIAGLILAEMAADEVGRTTDRPTRRVRRLSSHALPMAVVAVVAYALACTPLAGPTGLGEVSTGAFIGKTVLGAVLAYALMAPLVLADGRHRFLDSAPMQALGRWSYGIFIWHVAILAAVFELFSIAPFRGQMPLVWVLTAVLSAGVAAVSYSMVEEPLRRALRARERERAERERREKEPGQSGGRASVAITARQPSVGKATSAGS